MNATERFAIQSFVRFVLFALICFRALASDPAVVWPADPGQKLERTCFQTGSRYSGTADLRSDVAIVYGLDSRLPERIESWRTNGYRIHVMTGVSWGHYQDYLYGRFDGINHEDEAQTERNGKKISHGGDVYYMCPGTNYGKFLAVGVRRALDAGAEAIHLEEPEFWVRAGYEEGFKREWKSFYHDDWQPPDSSVDAQWRASKLKYYLYGRALQQVFDYVQEYNHRTVRNVRCYVPTHSLLNYAHWRIVSPESSLARVNGCSGYIAQVWTGTSRTPNMYRGVLKERTFETAFLEYGAMQNLVRSTGRTVWYLNDPIEDNPRHDWNDYQRNWESTLVASLFQPDVWQFEVAPWPERVFNGKYPRGSQDAKPIPAGYATELQVVFNALNDLKQTNVEWDCGTRGIGILVSDSLMFQRGEPVSSDTHLSHIYGLALPFLKRGMPVTPVQLENVNVHGYLEPFRILLLTYNGQKPLNSQVHDALAAWVKRGGILVVCDDDSDPYLKVREWWNQAPLHYKTPREHLFEMLGARETHSQKINKGFLLRLKQNPVKFASDTTQEEQLINETRQNSVAAGLPWRETNYLLLRRGPYIVAAGLDESMQTSPKELNGRFVNLFDPELKELKTMKLEPGSRHFLLDLDRASNFALLAAGCKVLTKDAHSYFVEGISGTLSTVLMSAAHEPGKVEIAGHPINSFRYHADEKLLWITFENEASPRELRID